MGIIKNMIGLDCGNSSFRIVLGQFDGTKITTTLIEQIPNEMIEINGYYHWDILKIFQEFKRALKKASLMVERIDSIGVCSWGVDFALFDKDKNMIMNPLSYRNTLGEEQMSLVSQSRHNQLFDLTGVLSDKINSVYTLKAYEAKFPKIFSIADKLLLIPDIFNFFLTGEMLNEPSEFSTTQLLDTNTSQLSEKAVELFCLDKSLFNRIGKHGEIIGKLRREICLELGIAYDIDVICVPSHDTASAILAIPTLEDDFAFISSGTWSLIGTELPSPVINDETKKFGLTNEVGVFGRITLLKNSAGMFIIQRIKKEYDAHLKVCSTWDELDQLADSYKNQVPLFNVNNPRFFNPTHMSKEIWRYLLETKQVDGELDYAAIITAVHNSMACEYAITISDTEKLVGKQFSKIYIVGGGSKNIKVNHYTAMASGKTVVACSKESTSLGNIGCQLAGFDKSYDIKKIRQIMINSVETHEYSAEYNITIVERYKKLSERK